MTRCEQELEKAQRLFDFLRGKIPDGFNIEEANRPKLTPDQAYTVIWFLGNEFWKVPDTISRCDVCGDLYHDHDGGETLDYGEAPYHFCEPCREGDEYAKKKASDPDAEV
jgi:hypothetical protein